MVHAYKERYYKFQKELLAHDALDRLQGIAQLGQLKQSLDAEIRAPTRFDHARFVTRYAEALHDNLYDRGRPLPWEFILALQVHDIGHPPYAHAGETVLRYLMEEWKVTDHPKGHNAIGRELLGEWKDRYTGRTINDIFKDMGAQPSLVLKFMEKHPWGSEEWKHGYGMARDPAFSPDKWGYVAFDSKYVGFDQSPPQWHDFIKFVTILEEGPGIDLNPIPGVPGNPKEMLKAYQLLYHRLYAEVYYGEKSLTSQRHFERAFELVLRKRKPDLKDLWMQQDRDVEKMLEESSSDCPEAFDHYMRYRKQFFYAPFIVFKIGDARKSLLTGEQVVSIDMDEKDALLGNAGNPLAATQLEDAIQEKFGIRGIYITQTDSTRYTPHNALLYDGVECVGSLFSTDNPHLRSLFGEKVSLFAQDDAHLGNIIDTGKQDFCVRFRVHEDDLLKAKSQAPDLEGFIKTFFSQAKKLSPGPKKDPIAPPQK